MGLATGSMLGDWRIDKQIGLGGMGIVFSAVHAVIGKHAAIKVLRRNRHNDDLHAAERFLQEARVVNQIQHPNIVDIFQLGRLDDGDPYLVMELLQGESLGDRLERGRVPTLEAIDYLLQVCGALAAAHACGVVHRDLKPDNIFLADVRGCTTVKLVDWGIAKWKAPPPDAPDVTGVGTMVGTPRYIAPEQARGLEVDERTDVYSLGCIAHELFLEAPPFMADNVADLLVAHLREPVAPPSEVWPDIPPVLERLLLAMLDKNASGRPSLTAVIEALIQARTEIEQGRSASHPVAVAVAVAASTAPVTAPQPKVNGTEPTMQADVPLPGAARRRAWSGLIAGTVALALAVVFAQVLGRSEAVARPVKPPRITAPMMMMMAPAAAPAPEAGSPAVEVPVEADGAAPPVAKKSPVAPKRRTHRALTPIDPDATIADPI